MTPIVFILILNPLTSAIFAAGLFLLWRHRRHFAYIRLLGFAFAAKTIGFLAQFGTLTDYAGSSRLLSNIAFMVAAIFLSGGLITRFGARPPYRLMTLVGAVSLSALTWHLFIAPSDIARVVIANFGLGIVLFIAAAWLRPLARGNIAERLQFWFVVLYGLACALRPLPMLLPGASPVVSLNSPYWLGVTGSDFILSLLLVLSIFSGIALDLFAKLRTESDHDALSGLLNRRGFQEQTTARLTSQPRSALPGTLILADLDHFKAINDSHGHAGGDRVIVAFAHALRAAVGETALVARLGGEEFGILLPAAQAAMGKLVAMQIRAAFSASIPELPPSVRVTASFGIAEFAAGEGLESALRRADQALYQAKADGRDCIRVAELDLEISRLAQLIARS